jgi:chaperonin GroES
MNTSGIEPLDVRVLVRPDPVEEVSKGGIIFAPTTVEQEKFATVKATLVAVGANAFAEASANPCFDAPQPGNRVMIAKYGGVNVKGADGDEYRIMNDVDVVALLKEGV